MHDCTDFRADVFADIKYGTSDHTYHAAGVSRRQVQIVHKLFQKCQKYLNLIIVFGITMKIAFK